MSLSKKQPANYHSIIVKQLTRICQAFYGIAIIVYGIQQFIYGNFRNVQLPAWQYYIPGLNVLACLTGAGLIAVGAAIIFEIKAREASLILGGIFLMLCCFVHVPYELISEPNKSYHLGLWENTLKELALAGGAFVIAGSFPGIPSGVWQKDFMIKYLEKIIPFGGIFFSITITSFGIAHFMYEKYIEALIPYWVPDHTFWAYFTGTALIGSGVFIILDIRKKTIAALLGAMIFCWFFVVHIPNTFTNSPDNKRNEIASAFDALAFSGTAFLISISARPKRGNGLN